MRKVVLLLLVLTALGVLCGVASAANGTIWPDYRATFVGRQVR
jgi:hypothetical protein